MRFQCFIVFYNFKETLELPLGKLDDVLQERRIQKVPDAGCLTVRGAPVLWRLPEGDGVLVTVEFLFEFGGDCLPEGLCGLAFHVFEHAKVLIVFAALEYRLPLAADENIVAVEIERGEGPSRVVALVGAARRRAEIPETYTLEVREQESESEREGIV